MGRRRRRTSREGKWMSPKDIRVAKLRHGVNLVNPPEMIDLLNATFGLDHDDDALVTRIGPKKDSLTE